jgi:hypothetical protein
MSGKTVAPPLVRHFVAFVFVSLAGGASARAENPASAPASVPATAAPFWSGPRIAGAMYTAYGLAAIVVGSVYAARSDEASSSVKYHCFSSDPDRCDSEGYALRRQASADGRVATISLGVGAVAVFVGLTLAWINPGAEPPARAARVHIGPLVGAGERGLMVGGTF